MVTLHSNHLQIQLDATGFTTNVYDGTTWQTGTRVVSRPLDTLIPTQLHEDGYSGQGEGFTWHSSFRPVESGIWIETEIEAAQEISLNPQMILWLGALDNMNDRQAHTWRQTILRAPTVNAGGLGGNDLPACYLYDHDTHTETICYFPPDAFAWAPQRFYEFTMREVLRYRPAGVYGLGLTAATLENQFTFPVGKHKLVWWFTQRYRETVPTPWEAQRSLIQAITPLLDTEPAQITDAISWSDMAQHTLEDLAHPDCWVNASGVEGLRAYVRGSSAVGRDTAPVFELMTQLDVLFPLLLWSQVTGNEAASEPVVKRLMRTLEGFHRPQWQFVANNFPPRAGDSFMDTWYFLENALIKLPWVAYLTRDERLKTMFVQALAGAQNLIHNTAYVPPLFADASDWQARGSLINPGVGGLYAAGCVIGFQLTGDRCYLKEALQALRTLHQLPPHLLTHEPQQLSYAAAAARYLERAGYLKDHEGVSIAGDFIRLSLRMGYWGKDTAVDHYDPRGMFQACASLCYPAYKENVETILPWAELLRDPALDTSLTKLMAGFMNLQRCHNYAFFEPYLPAEYRRGSCAYIPYEDLATAEFTHTAQLGKELYGAGEVFWSALLFDAFGQVDAPDVLCLSLDIPALELVRLPRYEWRFLLYNPASRARDVLLTTPAGSQTVHLEAQGLHYVHYPER